MYSNGYVGTNEDVQRIRKQEKQREEQRKKFEESKKQSNDRVETSGLRKFAASSNEIVEAAFKNDTVGLASKAEFIQKRLTLTERIEDDKKKKQKDQEELQKQLKEKKKQEREAKRPNLSFDFDIHEEEAEAEDDSLLLKPKAKKAKFAKFGKDPGAATDFLPDRDRDEQEQTLRKTLEQEWLADQAKVKEETLDITYSYWDGSGHRRKISVKKGDTVGRFLKAIREQLAPEFKELRHASVENLMYVKEDLILQHHLCFYDMIVNKARGKSGPLFDFDVREDVRLMSDASKEKMDSHAGKVVERHWYERNKHIFPASRWEEYDPEKQYGSYSIFG
mmetsp:Transcript_32292/g.58685  ORF Transcript_32292/g.58685 Transcript_32292/m.58685 type:complete len:335 (-) Transcript_32292:371-1375(-)